VDHANPDVDFETGSRLETGYVGARPERGPADPRRTSPARLHGGTADVLGRRRVSSPLSSPRITISARRPSLHPGFASRVHADREASSVPISVATCLTTLQRRRMHT